ncbi:cytochrome c3 family protein [Microvirga lenta]|uniref:cytochrome c3 family protein n=1 Tax=Microvirga lenta TaxID=2881337 RepID=UPI001CFF73FB|nr:cytochrome c3 family protein [Microvirga lenta]MCB5177496.1 cytochrome c3 family protein [Microvirga lenta]
MNTKTKIAGIGLFLGLATLLLVAVSPLHLQALNPGPMTPGHEALSCTSCHTEAPGTARQQIQANLAYLTGFRKAPVAFGYETPDSNDCSACHARPDDAHPLHRFAEPRFVEAVRVVRATTCLGCHREHQGTRVSSNTEFCAACHDDLVVKNDPVDIPHRILVAEERWSTCLGCHDYHGNRAREAQKRLADAFDVQTIRSYLSDGPDPYGEARRHPAKGERP